MATSNRRDVQLVIRAKDEAGKAFESATGALEKLLGVNNAVGASASKTGDRLSELATIALTIDKAYAKISGSADNAAAAFARQQASINEQKSQLAALVGQANAAAAAMAKLNSADAIVNAGRDQSGRIAQLNFLTQQYERLEAQQSKLRNSIAAGEAALDGQRSSLQQIGSTALAAEAAQEQLRRTIEQETAALTRQTVAAEKNARVLATVNRATGVTRDTSELADLNAQIAAHNALIEKLRAEQDVQTELARIEDARRRAATLLPGASNSGKSARDSAAVFMEEDTRAAKALETQLRETANAEAQMAKAAANLKAQIDPLGAIQDRLNHELAEANALYKAGKISATELAMATKLLKANADTAAKSLGQSGLGTGKPSLFGLTPYGIQNLGYQINDVVTQLASGTSITQTLAQQGGQLIQIFPKVGSAIVAAFTNPVILGTVAAVGALVLGLKEASDQAQRLRTFEGALAATADAAVYQAAGLAKASDELERYALKAEDAVKVVKTFMKEGVNPELMVEFGQAAKDMADVLGIDVADAAKQLAEAFTGGYDAIKKLDDATNFLTVTQRAHIRQMFEEGRASEARAEAFRIYSGLQQEAADKQRGEWSEAVRSLSNAWDGLLKYLANTDIIKSTIRELDMLGRAAQRLFNWLNGVETAIDSSEITRQIADVERRIANVQNRNGGNMAWDPLGIKANEMRGLTAELTRLRQERERLTAAERESATAALAGGADTRVQDTQRAAKATEDLAARTREVTEADKERSAAERVSAAEAEARREAMRVVEQDAFRAATDRAKQDYIAAQVAEARAKTEREITREREAQARQSRTEAEQRRRAYAADIADNGRENLISTAQRFSGMNENANRGDLQSFFRDNGINVDPKMTAWCAAFVNAVLKTNGLPGTDSLAARSFLGYGQDASSNPQVGDIVILNRGDNQAQGHVGFFQGFDENGNVKVLGGNQSNGVNEQTFDRNRVLGIRRAPNAGQVATEQVREQEQLAKAQERFNERLDNQIETRRQDTEQLRAQVGLTGEALIAKQREQAIQDALLKARQDAEKAGEDTSEENAAFQARLVLLAQTTGAYFDLANARNVAEARKDAVDRPVQELTAQRDAIQAQIEALQRAGDNNGAMALEASLANVNVRLQEAIDKSIQFYEALANNAPAMAALGMTAEQIQGIITKLQTTKTEGNLLGTQFLQTGKQINESFAQGAASAFDRFAQSVAEGKDVMSSLKDAFLQFASDFLRQIAQMIIKQAIFNAIGGATGSGSGGLGGGISGIISGLFHDGGTVGQSGGARWADPSWFNNAMRYHGGGVAGLRPGEVPAILEKGERIRTEEQEAALQRQLAGGGSGGGPAPQIKIVNAIDAGDMVQKGLASKVGERAFLNLIRENKGAVQSALA